MQKSVAVSAPSIAMVDWNDAAMQAQIKESYGKWLTPAEWNLFLAIGKFTGLNPFLREIYAVKYGKAAASIFIGRDGYRKSAQKHPEYDYHVKGAVFRNDKFAYSKGELIHEPNLADPGVIVGAYALAKRKGSTLSNYTFVRFEEYYAGNKEKYPDGPIKIKKWKDQDTHQWKEAPMGETTWDTKPATMIEKVAESQCLRMTFQELFAGTYDESEINEEELNNQNYTPPQSKYNPEKAKELSGIIAIADTIEHLNTIPSLVMDAYNRGEINQQEGGVIRKELEAKKAELTKPKDTVTAAEETFGAKAEEVKVDKKTGEIIDVDPLGINDSNLPPRPADRNVESHGLEDKCEDPGCIIHIKTA